MLFWFYMISCSGQNSGSILERLNPSGRQLQGRYFTSFLILKVFLKALMIKIKATRQANSSSVNLDKMYNETKMFMSKFSKLMVRHTEVLKEIRKDRQTQEQQERKTEAKTDRKTDRQSITIHIFINYHFTMIF